MFDYIQHPPTFTHIVFDTLTSMAHSPAVAAAVAGYSATDKKALNPLADVDARINGLDGTFPIPAETKAAWPKIRAAIATAARVIRNEVDKLGHANYNYGRLIHAIDLLQQAKDTAIMATILPHAPKELDARTGSGSGGGV